ncbi:hypothetical protein EHM76_00195 [bacterium]|nr:MAG: hypothetical protein EHM76_00195 [bacterium]
MENKIEINPSDFIIAATVGMRRAVDILRRGWERTGGNSHPDDAVFDNAILGAVAEFIVARMLNLHWEPKIGENTKGDVGGFVEVRCRNTRSGNEIGIHEPELTDTPYVLVLWHGGFNFEVAGWVRGVDARERGVWNEKRQCYFVPRPYRTLDELCALRILRTEAA